MINRKTVVVGMSGGVDSSVAAYLLKELGYHVIGVTMQIWQDEDETRQQESGGCCGLSAVDDARRVANKLGIPYHVMNFKADFKEKVIDYFIDEYLHGRTPNPCIACNRYVKWESLLERSMMIGADYIATGHYARIDKLENGRYAIKMSKTEEKDQTYALYNLTQEQLSHTLMPVGDYTKEEIREIASRISLRIAKKPDSQEICFVPDKDYAGFIEKSIEQKMPEGNFVTKEGEILGRHRGILHYTIGQRKGLGLAMGYPVFVTEIRPDTNEVVIGEPEEVYGKALIAKDVNWMSIEGFTKSVLEEQNEIEAIGKIRYSHKGARCIIRLEIENQIRVDFLEKVRAITPGQAVVFYDSQGYVMGGATILRAIG